MEDRTITPALHATPLICPHCGSADLTRDPEHPHEFGCAHCRTRSRMLPRQSMLLMLGWLCPACGHDNERGNRFCTQCGTPLTKPCPNCGAAMRVADKFCNACGKTRTQLVAEWYRAGKGALDAGRPWEAVLPLQRLAALDPSYGDVQALLERATRAATTPPAPTPVNAPSPAAVAVREAIASMKRETGRGRLFVRLTVVCVALLALVIAVSALVGLLLHSLAFGIFFFLFVCALIAANVWIGLHNI